MTTKYDIVSWRAWYVGGNRFNSNDTFWEDLPSEGVIFFVLYQRERKRRRFMLGVSLYWRDGKIFACDNTADAIIRSDLPSEYIKRGKWTTDAEYSEALAEATEMIVAPNENDRI